MSYSPQGSINPHDSEYLAALNNIYLNGVEKGDRTGTGTRSIFGVHMRFDLSKGFPLLTTKKMFTKGIIHELLWFLSGDTNIRYLVTNGIHIWDEWPYKEYVNVSIKNKEVSVLSQGEFIERIIEDEIFAKKWGSIGPGYGAQWRDFNEQGIDQISDIINSIKNNPNSRRHLVVAYNPAEAKNMLLPPCHSLFQFAVADGKLSCQLYQRSGDFFLGIPFNIASYSFLTHMIAKTCGLEVGEFIHVVGDAHIYSNHFSQVEEQLSRLPFEAPRLELNPKANIFEYTIDDFVIQDYQSHPAIKAPIAV